MSTILILLALVAVVLGFALFVAARPAGHQFTPLANVAEGTWEGSKSYLSSGAIAARGLLVAPGADAAHAALAGVGDIPLGVATDEAAAAEASISVNLLGVTKDTQLGVGSGAIAADAFLVPGANGTVRALPAAAGTYYIIGRNLGGVLADGADVPFVPCFPIQRIVA